jgi:hypothetical protein
VADHLHSHGTSERCSPHAPRPLYSGSASRCPASTSSWVGRSEGFTSSVIPNPSLAARNGSAAALPRDRCRDRNLQNGADSCGSVPNAAHKRSIRKTALESGKAPFPGRFPERGTEESNLALRFWRPPCYRYTSPPRSRNCRRLRTPSPLRPLIVRPRPHARISRAGRASVESPAERDLNGYVAR